MRGLLLVFGMFIVGATALSVRVGAQSIDDEVQLQSAVVYAKGLSKSQSFDLLMDIYSPAAGCPIPCPVIVGIHGGAFLFGSRQDPNWQDLGETAARNGFVLASIDYSLFEDDPAVRGDFRDHYVSEVDRLVDDADRAAFINGQEGQLLRTRIAGIRDAREALQWIADNADTQGFDLERVALWGSSAGAIVANNLAYGLDEMGVESPVEVAAVIDLWGRLGDGFEISAGDPALMIVHGEEDETVRFSLSQDLYQGALDAPIHVQYFPVPNRAHGFREVDLYLTQVGDQLLIDHVLDFLQTALGWPDTGCYSDSAALCDGFDGS